MTKKSLIILIINFSCIKKKTYENSRKKIMERKVKPINIGRRIIDWSNQSCHKSVNKQMIQGYIVDMLYYGPSTIVNVSSKFYYVILVSMVQTWIHFYFNGGNLALASTVPISMLRTIVITDFMQLIMYNNVINVLISMVHEDHQSFGLVICISRFIENYFGKQKMLPLPSLMVYTLLPNYYFLRRHGTPATGNMQNMLYGNHDRKALGFVCANYIIYLLYI